MRRLSQRCSTGKWRWSETGRSYCAFFASALCLVSGSNRALRKLLDEKYRFAASRTFSTVRALARSGDFRILFEVEGSTVVIRTIRDRKEAYE